MKRRRILLLLALAVVAVAAGLALSSPRRPKEPVHLGKSYYQWAQAMEDSMTPQQSAEARAGLDAIGTNAVPILLHDFTRSISPWRRRMNAWARAHPSLKLSFRDDLQLIHRAALGLMHLGSNGAPAAPVVSRYLGDSIRGQLAGRILGCTGEPAVPQLCAAVSSTNSLVVSNAVAGLRRLRSKSEAADHALREWEAAAQAPRARE